MAPSKFGLFKTRSRENEQPSTENLLKSNELMAPASPVPSTSRGYVEESKPQHISRLVLDSDDEDAVSERLTPVRRSSQISKSDDSNDNHKGHYHLIRNPSDVTSICTLNENEMMDQDHSFDDERTLTLEQEYEDLDGASTLCDANSIQFDETSLAASDDISVYCGPVKKPKKSKSKEKEVQLTDEEMWKATDLEVMDKLLHRTCSLDEQIKWEAIATSRGICTLTDNCKCLDCKHAKYLSGITDGDGGLTVAPLINSVAGCAVQ